MKYVICAPAFRHNSAGIRTLYELQKQLILIGEDAITANLPFKYQDDYVLIVPEVFPRHLFDHTKIVRWYLNKPIPAIIYGDDELKITHSNTFIDNAAMRLKLDVMEPIFHNKQQERIYDVAYIGKGEYDGEECPNRLLITPDWPPTREDMADLFNKSKTLYSWDDCTAIVDEAIACGCETYICKNGEKKLAVQNTESFSTLNDVRKFNYLVKETFFNG